MEKAKEIIALLGACGKDGIDLSGYNYGVTTLMDSVDNVSILEEHGEEPALMVYDGSGDVVPFEDLTKGEQDVIGGHIISILLNEIN